MGSRILPGSSIAGIQRHEVRRREGLPVQHALGVPEHVSRDVPHVVGSRDVGNGPATTVQRAMTRSRRDARPYHRSGEHIVAKAVPYLVQRVADPNVPDASLTPLERTVRGVERMLGHASIKLTVDLYGS